MRTILHITAPSEYGGLESMVGSLSTACAAAGDQVGLVLVLEPQQAIPAWAVAAQDAGVHLYPIHVGARAYLAERRAIGSILSAHPTAIAHIHGDRLDVVESGVARALRLPVVSTAHGFARSARERWLYERLQVRAWRRMDAVVAVSAVLYAELLRRGIPQHRLHLIPNGGGHFPPSLLDRQAARRVLGVPDDGVPVIGWVGRLSPEKGPDLAVDAWAQLGVSARLCIVGDGREREALEERVRNAGLRDAVRFTGAIPNAGTLLRAFDAVLLSSHTEGTPMVILESVAARIPVLATAVGGVPSLLGDGYHGLIAHPTPDCIAGAVRRFLPEAARGVYQRQLDAIAERLTATDWVGAYRDLYARLRSDVA